MKLPVAGRQRTLRATHESAVRVAELLLLSRCRQIQRARRQGRIQFKHSRCIFLCGARKQKQSCVGIVQSPSIVNATLNNYTDQRQKN
jgi:hypothetical protein